MHKTVLVIDDSSSLRAVVSQLLTDAGYHVSTASGATEALACLDGKKMSLIFCDLYMPEMDGLQLISKVKSMPAYKFTPVIMLSTEKSDEKRQQAYDLGIKAWIIKPFNPNQLLNAVSKITNVH